MPFDLLTRVVRRHRLAFSLLGVFAASVIIIPACGPGGDGAVDPDPIATTLTFESGPTDVVAGQSATYVARIKDPSSANVSGGTVTYALAAADQALASINPTTGVLTANTVQSAPTSTVTVTASGSFPPTDDTYRAPTAVTRQVTIRSRITGITLSAVARTTPPAVPPPSTNALTLRVGDAGATLTAVPAFVAGAPTAPPVVYTYTSSNPALVSVTNLGSITAVGPTPTSTPVTITASAEGATSNTVSVTVLPALVTTVVVTVPASTTLPLVTGEQVTLQTSVSNAPPGTGTTTYSSSNANQVSVDANGRINALAPTPTPVRITARYTNGATTAEGFVDVSVAARVATTVSLLRVVGATSTPTTAETLARTTSATFRAIVRDQRGDSLNSSVTWTSSNPDAATVNSSGMVTAVGTGSAIITATSTSNANVSARVTITVPAPPASPTITITHNDPPVPVSSSLAIGVTSRQRVGVTVANPVAGGTLAITVRDPSLVTYEATSNTGSAAVGDLIGKGTGSTFLDVAYTANGVTITQSLVLLTGTPAVSRVARVILEPQNSTVANPVGFSFRPRFLDANGVQLTAQEVAADGGTIRFTNSNDATGTVTQSVTAPTTAAFASRAAGTTNVGVVYSKNNANIAADNTNVTVVSSAGNVGSLTISTNGDARTVKVGAANSLLLQIIVRDQNNVIVTTGTAPTVTLSPASPTDPIATVVRDTDPNLPSGFFYRITGVKPGNVTLTAALGGSVTTSVPIVIVP